MASSSGVMWRPAPTSISAGTLVSMPMAVQSYSAGIARNADAGVDRCDQELRSGLRYAPAADKSDALRQKSEIMRSVIGAWSALLSPAAGPADIVSWWQRFTRTDVRV